MRAMWIDDTRRAAQNRWPEILQTVAGLNRTQTTPTKRGMPCPYCGGTDRYEFKQPEDGYYLCRGCGAGDGWSMVMKILSVDFCQAAEQVADFLRIDKTAQQTSYRALAHIQPVAHHYPPPDTTSHKTRWIWQQASPAEPEHPYLVAKHLPPLKLKQYKGSLVSPLYDQHFNLVNLQFIQPDGKKCFLRGGQTKDCFQWWGSLSWSVFVCEGVADAISVHIHNHWTRMTVAAYSASNIASVGQFLRAQLPGHRLVLVIDNDKPTDQRKWRPGMAALLKAHSVFNDILLPPEGMDVSDLWVNRHV